MKRQAYMIISTIAVSLVAFSARAENPSRPNELNAVAPATARAVEVGNPVAAGSVGVNASPAVDNAARNELNRTDPALKPFDPGTSPAGTDTTATQRDALVNDPVTADSTGADASPAADNAARNERDRNDRTLTPFDQGNSQADTDATAEIRKGILAGKDMSVNAQNVKIITSNGRVTLRGTVQSDEEKRLIGEIADRFAPSGNVDNQLEVALESGSN